MLASWLIEAVPVIVRRQHTSRAWLLAGLAKGRSILAMLSRASRTADALDCQVTLPWPVTLTGLAAVKPQVFLLLCTRDCPRHRVLTREPPTGAVFRSVTFGVWVSG